MRINLVITTLLLFFCVSIKAQLDSTRMKTFNSQLQVGLFVSDNNATTNFVAKNSFGDIEQLYILKPTVGFQFAYNGAILVVATGVPIPSLRTTEYNITDAININGYVSRPKYIFWGAVRRFEGVEYRQNIPSSKDASYLNLTSGVMYIFSENNYSFRAAYRQADQQLKSGGSFLARGLLNYTDLVDSNLTNLRLDEFAGVSSYGMSLLGGYGYTLNFNENWFISALVLGGVDVQRVKPKFNSTTTTSSFSFAPTYDFKSSIGYNSDKFFISLLFSVDNRLSINNIDSNINLDYDYIKIDLRFGTRIDAPKILTKIPFIN